MVERIKVLERDLTLQEPLGDMKKILWANNNDSINEAWPPIQVIFEQIEPVKVATKVVHKTRRVGR